MEWDRFRILRKMRNRDIIFRSRTEELCTQPNRPLTRKVDRRQRTENTLQVVAKINRQVDDLSTISVRINVGGDVQVVGDSCGRDRKGHGLRLQEMVWMFSYDALFAGRHNTI